MTYYRLYNDGLINENQLKIGLETAADNVNSMLEKDIEIIRGTALYADFQSKNKIFLEELNNYKYRSENLYNCELILNDMLSLYNKINSIKPLLNEITALEDIVSGFQLECRFLPCVEYWFNNISIYKDTINSSTRFIDEKYFFKSKDQNFLSPKNKNRILRIKEVAAYTFPWEKHMYCTLMTKQINKLCALLDMNFSQYPQYKYFYFDVLKDVELMINPRIVFYEEAIRVERLFNSPLEEVSIVSLWIRSGKKSWTKSSYFISSFLKNYFLSKID